MPPYTEIRASFLIFVILSLKDAIFCQNVWLNHLERIRFSQAIFILVQKASFYLCFTMKWSHNHHPEYQSQPYKNDDVSSFFKIHKISQIDYIISPMMKHCLLRFLLDLRTNLSSYISCKKILRNLNLDSAFKLLKCRGVRKML